MLRLPAIAVLAAVASLVLATGGPAGAADTEEGFESLFDGETLAGWDGNPELWQVVDGAIRGVTSDDRPIDENQFLIWDGEVEDFVLRLQFRIADRGAGNSGVQYRSARPEGAGKWIVGGYQADIERTNKYMGILYEERGRGIVALRGEDVVLEESADGFEKKVVGSVGDPAEIVADMRPGEWQNLEIVAQGNKLVHILNGAIAVRVVDNDTKHASQRGLLALQLHRGPAMQIEFRSIRLKRLAADAAPETESLH